MSNDDHPIAWDQMELDELHELLAGEIPALSPEQTAEIAELLRAAGGIDEALDLLEQLKLEQLKPEQLKPEPATAQRSAA